jgi:hypothetical protein
MRRITAMLVIALVGLVGSTAPVAASTDRPSPGIEVDGDFQGTSTWTYETVTCGFVHQHFTGTYALGPRDRPGGIYDLDVCVSLPAGGEPEGFPTNGTFVVTLGRHVTLSGTVSGAQLITGTDIPGLDLTLTVTASSGTPRPVRGTITATGITDQSGGLFATVETGTFTSHLHFAR